MVKVRPADIARHLKALDPAIRAVLLYGPDEGLVRERAAAISAQVVDDLADPFRVTRLTADQLRADPALLADELGAIAMTGGRRLVRLDGAADAMTSTITSALQTVSSDSLLVIVAGELAPRSSLRKAAEAAGDMLAIACYADEARDLGALIRQVMDAAGLTPDNEAMSYLLEALGGDRALSRVELDKLALYKADDADRRVTLADARAMVGDSAAWAVSQIATAATAGDPARLDRLIDRAFVAGESPVGVLRALARRLQQLHLARGHMDRGMTARDAVGQLKPPIFFKERDSFTRQLAGWSSDRLEAALNLVGQAERDCKSTGLPAQAVCARACLRVASGARTRN